MEPHRVQDLFMEALCSGDRAEWQRVLKDCSPDIGQCLLAAVREQSHEAVSDVLQYRPSLNVEDRQGQRPIHLAARHGPSAIVSLLASAGCTVNCSSAEGWTPLHIACHYGMADVAEELISHGASVNAARTENKLTPLHVAIQMEQEHMIGMLIEHFANPNVRSSVDHGQVSALTMAVEKYEKHSILETFLKAASRKNEIEYRDVNGSFPLHGAVEKGHVRTCQLLLLYLRHMKPIIEDPSGRALQEAFMENTNKEKFVLNLGDEKGRTALHLAIVNNRKEIVEMLLDAGCDTERPLEKDVFPLEFAIHCVKPVNVIRNSFGYEHIDEDTEEDTVQWDDAIVQVLVDRCVNLHVLSAAKEYPIHMAVNAGLFYVALKIVAQTPHKVNVTNVQGETPLHIACRIKARCYDQQARFELIRSLLDMGLGVNALTKNSTCPLIYAVRDGDVEVVAFLLRYSADMTLGDRTDFTALHYAAMGRSVAILETLLDHRPDAVGFDNGGPSLVNAAVSTMNVQALQCLVHRQADLNFVDPRNGSPPLHAAITNFVADLQGERCPQMVELLVRKGADLHTRSRSGLTPLQTLIHTLICVSGLPDGREMASNTGLTTLKMLVEAGSSLEPWTLVTYGIQRRPPFQSMAFCGLLSCVYYLANVGWPLHREIPPPSRSSPGGGAGQPPANWATLPGNTPEQDNMHAYLMLRNANPFTLLHLARTTIRATLMDRIMETHGGQRREIVTSIDKLPVPAVIRKFLRLLDSDYSSVENCWEKLLHLLPSAATEEAIKAGLTS